MKCLRQAVHLTWVALLFSPVAKLAAAEPQLRAGFAKTDITPDVQGQTPVWIGGWGPNRQATRVHDPLYCRAVVLDDGQRRIALACVDLVGLQYPAVERIRARLGDFAYVLVASSHNHEGPDVVGFWGPTQVTSGVDPRYIDLVVDRTVEAIHAAARAVQPVSARYGTARDESLLVDDRLPVAPDGVLRALRLDDDKGEPAGLIVQWNCHPESLGFANTEISADFPWATIAQLERQYACPAVLFIGAVGGRISNPALIEDDACRNVRDECFRFAEVYGAAVAKLGQKAIASAQPLRLAPFTVSAKKIAVPLTNKEFQDALALGLFRRPVVEWTGDVDRLGPTATTETPADKRALVTEVAYLRLGELHIACVPGELFTELMYGKYPNPSEQGVDFPDAPLEPAIMTSVPSEKALLIGLANDEIGQIIPKRQWDQQAPFAFGRHVPQYGELHSLGPDLAPSLMEAFVRRVREASQPATN